MECNPKLLILTRTKPAFRIPEIKSIACLGNFESAFNHIDPTSFSETDQIIIVNLTVDQLNFLLSRSMSIHEGFELYSHGKTYPEMLEKLNSEEISTTFKKIHYNKPEETICCRVTGLNKKLSNDRNRQMNIFKQTFDQHPEVTSKQAFNYI